MANEQLPGEQTGQLESLLERWQTSLDLHAKYAALDEERYWHVQPWPKHERPQRWIIQLARKRILALKRIVPQRQAEGDRAFIEGIEIMGFLATLVGLTSVERFIPLATHETERRDVLARETGTPPPRPPRGDRATAHAAAGAQRESTSRTAENRKAVEAQSRTGEHKRTAETTRQMPQLPNSKVYRMLAAQRAGVPLKEPRRRPPKREARRDPAAPPPSSRRRRRDDHADGTRGDRGRGALVRLGQAVARTRRHDRAAVRAARALGNPPHPAHLPRPHRRRRHPPPRLADA